MKSLLDNSLTIFAVIVLVAGGLVIFKGEWMKKTITTLTESNTALAQQNDIFKGQIQDLMFKVNQAHQEIKALQRIASGSDIVEKLGEVLLVRDNKMSKEHIRILERLEDILNQLKVKVVGDVR